MSTTYSWDIPKKKVGEETTEERRTIEYGVRERSGKESGQDDSGS